MIRWIEEHFVLQRCDNMNIESDQPPGRRHFYTIQEQEDGTVDVYLRPHVLPLTTEDGATDYDVEMLVVRGVEPFDGMEEDIRARYDDWCASAEVVYL